MNAANESMALQAPTAASVRRWEADAAVTGPVAEARVLVSVATYNERGQIEGVKYGQIATVLVNAVKELRTQIELQQDQLRRQQLQIEELKKQVSSQSVDK